jgi:hypothetical protein
MPPFAREAIMTALIEGKARGCECLSLSAGWITLASAAQMLRHLARA